jgi:hypothetical protein
MEWNTTGADLTSTQKRELAARDVPVWHGASYQVASILVGNVADSLAAVTSSMV